MLQGHPHQLASSSHFRFAEQLLERVLDGAFRDFHARGNFFVRQPLHYQLQDFQLARIERWPFGWYARTCSPRMNAPVLGDVGNDGSKFRSISFFICREPHLGKERLAISAMSMALHRRSELRSVFPPQ